MERGDVYECKKIKRIEMLFQQQIIAFYCPRNAIAYLRNGV